MAIALRLIFAMLLLASALPADAQDALAGKRLYLDSARLRGTGASCVDCHFALPGVFAISAAANDPARIARAIEAIPQMSAFRGRLSATDIADLAAYIGDPAVPSPDLRVVTGGASSDRVDFGRVAVGSTGVATAHLQNGGTVAMRLTSQPRLVGASSSFSVPGSTCTAGLVLDPGVACRIDLLFEAAGNAPGQRTAALQVDHDWVGGTVGIALIAEVTSASPPVSGVAVPAAGGGGGAVGAGAALLLWIAARRRRATAAG